MTSSRKLSTSKLSPWFLFPLLLFVALMIHGALLGLTDDEAYYWVLAQRPALGYAFHPPMVAWLIALAQSLFGWALGTHSPALVRLPAALCSSGILFLGLRWMEKAGAPESRLKQGGFVILSLAGVFAASWMMVPDLPLFLGWMLVFSATWDLCFEESRKGPLAMLGVGCVLAILSKYSGILAVGSSFIAISLWARRELRLRAFAALGIGVLLALIPILIWNSGHEWASILYQIRDRHGDADFSLKRYGKFWASQLLFAGPPLILFSLGVFRRARVTGNTVSRFILVFALPGFLVFCTQPLWADFKPHWALIVWLPFALELGWAYAQDLYRAWARPQIVFGWTVIVVSLLFCHFPLQSWLMEKLSGKVPDPRWDVTNDMYGWREFARSLPQGLRVVGSRYQTASQIAFALGDADSVVFIPRDLKQRDEWASPAITDNQGPAWPKLLQPVLFIADNRYDAGPEFKDAQCVRTGHFRKKRGAYLAKSFEVWKCDPVPAKLPTS